MILETSNLTKMYGSKTGCSDICLAIDKGQIFGFLGPNGAGKSTLVKMLVGLLFPTSGTASVLRRPLGDLEARRKTGFLPENFRYQEWLTGEELLSFHASLYKLTGEEKMRRIPAVLNQVGLGGKGKQKIGSYSKGMQQRIGLACALLPDPDLVFLDEPTSALDPLGRREVREIMMELRSRGKTVFLNSHLLSEVEMVCDQVAIINQGRIMAAGAMDELLVETVAVEMQVEGLTPPLINELAALSRSCHVNDSLVRLTLGSREQIPSLAAAVVRSGAYLFSLQTRHNSLEDLFVNLIQGGGEGYAGSGPVNC
ncbi:putative ABC transporter ATP-binding protein YxlF [Pelotomaculum schinkii]|uniref:Putative ABC transporter ATP-binding protein YxlF n=1 Tax=Pelotomaculum schinkii TaxID=78350 RepID=A0A4Y7REL0_9FIRM|nr:ABC transporter ATP-binding protein [Pelotomaculum schinkii]TEB07455.1 putative ABC transporter ATP-binding protein YxlF [Pelotomaculum schinkii]